jgi:(p)ppGpp synthase/HD superfamily hydrolase
MKLTAKLQKAINLAATEHFGQSRKGIDVPYIIHPYSVAVVLSKYTDDQDTLVAAMLHDVLEDCQDYCYEQLVMDFGEKIAMIVDQVSQVTDFTLSQAEKKATWVARKKQYLDNLEKSSKEALMVCAADKLHNLHSMFLDYKTGGVYFLNSFNSTVNKRLWYYREVLAILKKRLNNKIVQALEEKYNQAVEVFGNWENFQTY